ncbi:hypothetical protein ElyMa_007056100 [Elysia marginata]|uniref:Exonuclease domain-containing protein n=1 Tax=Elysia marginata TaxID=1093978 RepID=A0AAV4JZZ3_9GAST|nr:hypothetical protein ElyMa_007056100 [Elysia marginata]
MTSKTMKKMTDIIYVDVEYNTCDCTEDTAISAITKLVLMILKKILLYFSQQHIITLSSINHLSWKGGQAPPRTNPASHDAPPSPALPLPSPPSSPPAVATNGQVVATALQEEDAEGGAAVFPAQEQAEEVPPGGSESQNERKRDLFVCFFYF